MIYLYWRLMNANTKVYDNISWRKTISKIQLAAYLLVYIVSILALIDSFARTNLLRLNGWLDENTVMNRFVRIPIAVAPIVGLFFWYFERYKVSIEKKMKFFDSMNDKQKEIKNRWLILWIVFSAIFFIICITSGAWTKEFRFK